MPVLGVLQLFSDPFDTVAYVRSGRLHSHDLVFLSDRQKEHRSPKSRGVQRYVQQVLCGFWRATVLYFLVGNQFYPRKQRGHSFLHRNLCFWGANGKLLHSRLPHVSQFLPFGPFAVHNAVRGTYYAFMLRLQSAQNHSQVFGLVGNLLGFCDADIFYAFGTSLWC